MRKVLKRSIFLFCMLALVGCGKNGKVLVQEEDILNNTVVMSRNTYLYQPEEENLVVDKESNAVFYNNIIRVWLSEELTDEKVNEIVASVKGQLVGKMDDSMIQIAVPSFDSKHFDKMKERLFQFDEVVSVRYEIPDLSSASDDKKESSSAEGDWWIDAIGMKNAWNYAEYLDKDQIFPIGIVDTGIEEEHDAFLRDNKSKVTIIGTNTKDDHATHVAGIMAAEKGNPSEVRGISDGATILSSDGWPTPENDKGVANLILSDGVLVEQGARVVNNSFSLMLYKNDYQQDINSKLYAKIMNVDVNEMNYDQYIAGRDFLRKQAVKQTLDLLLTRIKKDDKFIFVQGVGNGFEDTAIGYDAAEFGNYFNGITQEIFDEWKTEINNPTNDISYSNMRDHIIIVGAVENKKDSDGNYYITEWSSYGENVDIIAPGNQINSAITNNRTGEKSGTSMAAPMVSAAANLIWSFNPELSAKEVKELLIDTATSAIGVTDGDKGKIHPMLNVGAAVEKVIDGNEDLKRIVPYKAVIDAYEHEIKTSEKIDKSKADQYVNKYAVNQYLSTTGSRLGYAFYDLDSNSVDELLVGVEDNGSFDICDIWTTDGQMPIAITKNQIDGLNLCENMGSLGMGLSKNKVRILKDGAMDFYQGGDGFTAYIGKDGKSLQGVDIYDTAAWKRIDSQIEANEFVNINSLEWIIMGDYSKPSVCSESELRNVIEKYTSGNISEWVYDDFNNDGMKEAFATINKNSEYMDIYYLSSTGEIIPYGNSRPGHFGEVIPAGEIKYVTWVEGQEYAFVIGVEGDNGLFEPDISGQYVEFYYDSSLKLYVGINIFTHDVCKSGYDGMVPESHEYETYYDYDTKTHTFTHVKGFYDLLGEWSEPIVYEDGVEMPVIRATFSEFGKASLGSFVAGGSGVFTFDGKKGKIISYIPSAGYIETYKFHVEKREAKSCVIIDDWDSLELTKQ